MKEPDAEILSLIYLSQVDFNMVDQEVGEESMRSQPWKPMFPITDQELWVLEGIWSAQKLSPLATHNTIFKSFRID